MAAAQHKLSRRAVLAGACGAAVPLPRHSGLDPESRFLAAAGKERWTPDQVRGDEKWEKASALYARAVAGLEAVAHTEDDDLYDRALGRHGAALARLLRTPAPDLAAVSRKLELILGHSVFESGFAESCFAVLQADIRRFAGIGGGAAEGGVMARAKTPRAPRGSVIGARVGWRGFVVGLRPDGSSWRSWRLGER